MPRSISSFELNLSPRPAHTTLTRWLHSELRQAILEGRLLPGSRLPATRDFADQYNVSRGTVVAVFEQLQSEGYLQSNVGGGTWVKDQLQTAARRTTRSPAVPRKLPPPLTGLDFSQPARPFRCHESAFAGFPAQIWTRLAGRRLRRAPSSLFVEREPGGYRPLREAIVEYLAFSRGVNCSWDQIVVVSGVQQALDLLARVLVKPGEAVWIEDPGYYGAVTAFRNSRAKIIPVPVDEHGISVLKGRRLYKHAKAAFLTPAHQFPLGVTMPLERRLEILAWSQEVGAFLIEDDYDSEYRFEGQPVPALQGLDKAGTVILLGSFNKLMFPSLRLGYLVLPPALVDPLLSFRLGTDHNFSGLDQAILTDFIVDGHLARHIRKTRDLYSRRLAALQEWGRKYLAGLLDISPIQAGLYTAGFLRNGLSSLQAEEAATANQVETLGLERFVLKRTDVYGLLLGFAAFNESEIRRGLVDLSRALETKKT